MWECELTESESASAAEPKIPAVGTFRSASPLGLNSFFAAQVALATSVYGVRHGNTETKWRILVRGV